MNPIKWHLFQGCKDDSVYTHQLIKYTMWIKAKVKHHIIREIDAKKDFNQIQQLFIIKILDQTGLERTFLKTVMAMYKKPIVSIILNIEKLK